MMRPMTAPVSYIVVGFPGNNFTGEIVPALAELVDGGMIRIVDLVFIAKDGEGNVLTFEYDELEDVGFHGLEGEVTGIVSEADIAEAAEMLEPDSSAALLIWEDLWAAKFAQAVLDADGVLLASGRLPQGALEMALADLDDA